MNHYGDDESLIIHDGDDDSDDDDGDDAESEKPCQRGSIAVRKVFAIRKVFVTR